MSTFFLIAVLGFYFIYDGICSYNGRVEMIPERAEIVSSNPDYVLNPTINVRRYSRKGKYIINFGGTNVHTWNNNISVNLVLYEYLHNEYRRSFIEMHFKLCDLINKDELIGYTLRTIGIVCPLPAGQHYYANASIVRNGYAYVWPFTKAKAAISIYLEPKHILIADGNLMITIKQQPIKVTKP